jgi:DNA segregation ATPase FtsK/SpoIIIE, S-DNA-T family
LPPLIEPGVPTLVVVDDAESVDDDRNVLNELVSVHGADVTVVAAGRAEVLRGLFNHWTKTLRRSKLGVLLRPNPDLDGELLGVALPRRTAVAMTVGRGYLVNSGEYELVQVAEPSAPDSTSDRSGGSPSGRRPSA